MTSESIDGHLGEFVVSTTFHHEQNALIRGVWVDNPRPKPPGTGLKCIGRGRTGLSLVSLTAFARMVGSVQLIRIA